MIKNVFVPLDGSKLAETALVPARVIASRAGAELVSLSAPWPPHGFETPRSYLDAQAALIDRNARPWLVLDHDAVDAILLAAEEPGGLVCMATHGRGGLGQSILGSVAAEVTRRSTAPVVLVGPSVEPDWLLADEPFVVAGIDGSARSRAAAVAAGELARSVAGRVRVVEVVRPSDVVTFRRFPGGRSQCGIHRGRESWAHRCRASRLRKRVRANSAPCAVPGAGRGPRVRRRVA